MPLWNIDSSGNEYIHKGSYKWILIKWSAAKLRSYVRPAGDYNLKCRNNNFLSNVWPKIKASLKRMWNTCTVCCIPYLAQSNTNWRFFNDYSCDCLKSLYLHCKLHNRKTEFNWILHTKSMHTTIARLLPSDAIAFWFLLILGQWLVV